MIDLPGLGEDELRRRIRALTGADEGERVAALLAEADAALGDGATITATAAGLIEAIRGKQRYRAGINALLAEYSLSSREGVVLMCLAEALLRVPDRLTADRLIRDKLGGGDWLEPTVLTDASHEMQIVAEETFAAVLPVMPFDTEEEAVRLANDTVYGLSGCVFSTDVDRARRIAGQLNAGAISINDAALTGMVHDAPKQSFGLSGLGGSRMGKPSLQRFYRLQALLINDGTPSPWWFTD